jgi:hypothetical protein
MTAKNPRFLTGFVLPWDYIELTHGGDGGHQTDGLTLRYHWFFKYHKIEHAHKI